MEFNVNLEFSGNYVMFKEKNTRYKMWKILTWNI